MENNKTSMQELFDNLQAINISIPNGVKKIFLEKEKEQVIEAFNRGMLNSVDWFDDGIIEEAEQYYKETYKNNE